MLARFFIDRPVLAWVISIVVVLLGAIAAGFLPVAEYPEIAPPTVRVTANYPGANAHVVADTVAAPIEQQVVGVEGMLYMSSQSNNDGSYTLDVTFEIGTNVNMARVVGVGDVLILGQQDYSMRVWLDPDKLQSRNMTVGDVIRVLREQNVQVASGQTGQPPVPKGQDFQYTLSTLGRLVDADQFANIILKTGSDGEVTYLRDVSRSELGARNQDTLSRLDRRPSSGVGVFLLPGSNALDTADRIRATMREQEARF